MKFKFSKNKKIVFGIGVFGMNLLLLRKENNPSKKNKKKKVNFQYF